MIARTARWQAMRQLSSPSILLCVLQEENNNWGKVANFTTADTFRHVCLPLPSFSTGQWGPMSSGRLPY